MLSQKKPLVQDDPEARLAEFEKAFGDLGKVEAEFLKYMTTRVR